MLPSPVLTGGRILGSRQQIVTNEFNSAKHDFPAVDSTRVRYILAALPRSGSTLLGRTLWGTGLAGAPAEYLNPVNMSDFYDRWGSFSLPALVKRILDEGLRTYSSLKHLPLERYLELLMRHRTSPNGVFGTKVHYHQITGLLERRVELDELLDEPKYLQILRRDHLRQAISHLRAEQTNQWSAGKEAEAEPRYDFEALRRKLTGIGVREEEWNRYFAARGIEPFRTTYEELIADFEGTIRAILDFLEIDHGGVDIGAPPMQKQADELTEEWVERYRGEAVAAGIELPEPASA